MQLIYDTKNDQEWSKVDGWLLKELFFKRIKHHLKSVEDQREKFNLAQDYTEVCKILTWQPPKILLTQQFSDDEFVGSDKEMMEFEKIKKRGDDEDAKRSAYDGSVSLKTEQPVKAKKRFHLF